MPDTRKPRRTKTGRVSSNKMNKTVVVDVELVTRHRLYGRTLRRTRSFKAHDETNRCEIGEDRKSTRLNSSHVSISYAVFCLKKKKKKDHTHEISQSHTDTGPILKSVIERQHHVHIAIEILTLTVVTFLLFDLLLITVTPTR